MAAKESLQFYYLDATWDRRAVVMPADNAVAQGRVVPVNLEVARLKIQIRFGRASRGHPLADRQCSQATARIASMRNCSFLAMFANR